MSDVVEHAGRPDPDLVHEHLEGPLTVAGDRHRVAVMPSPLQPLCPSGRRTEDAIDSVPVPRPDPHAVHRVVNKAGSVFSGQYRVDQEPDPAEPRPPGRLRHRAKQRAAHHVAVGPPAQPSAERGRLKAASVQEGQHLVAHRRPAFRLAGLVRGLTQGPAGKRLVVRHRVVRVLRGRGGERIAVPPGRVFDGRAEPARRQPADHLECFQAGFLQGWALRFLRRGRSVAGEASRGRAERGGIDCAADLKAGELGHLDAAVRIPQFAAEHDPEFGVDDGRYPFGARHQPPRNDRRRDQAAQRSGPRQPRDHDPRSAGHRRLALDRQPAAHEQPRWSEQSRDRRLWPALELDRRLRRNVREPLPDSFAIAPKHPRPVRPRQPVPPARREAEGRLRVGPLGRRHHPVRRRVRRPREPKAPPFAERRRPPPPARRRGGELPDAPHRPGQRQPRPVRPIEQPHQLPLIHQGTPVPQQTAPTTQASRTPPWFRKIGCTNRQIAPLTTPHDRTAAISAR